MKEKKQWMQRILSFCMVAMLAVGMLFAPVEKVFAETEVNEKIQDAKNSVVQIMVCVQDESGKWVNLVGGTGFLVGTEANAQYVITNDHVANATSTDWLTDEVSEGMETISGQSDYTKIKTKVRVVLRRDSYIDATVVQSSSATDLAILKLEQPIYNRAPIALDAVSEPQSTEVVYTLGFPGIVQAYQDDKIYTSDDVTVTDGSISKIAVSSVITGSPISYINHSARIAEGNSGGPLLNADGNVIGVNSWYASTDQTTYYYSIQIKEVTELLDAMGIDYMKADGTETAGTTGNAGDAETTTPEATEAPEATVEPTEEPQQDDATKALMDELSKEIQNAKDLDTSKYTEESAKAFDQVLTDAEKVEDLGQNANEDDIQKAMDKLRDAQKGLTEKSGMNKMVIIIIAVVAAVAVIAVILVIVLNSQKKKKQEEAARKAALARERMEKGNMGNAGGFQPNVGFTPGDTSAYRDSDEGSTPTGVLNDGSSATTVLSQSQVPSATLIRKKTGERITIDKATFRIGKERNKVDYCVSGNSNISRMHASIIYKNGTFYLVDNNATNGTSVNGASISGGKERALTGNETIRLADEEFLFRI